MFVWRAMLLPVQCRLEAMPSSVPNSQAHFVARAELKVNRASAPRSCTPVVPWDERIQKAARELEENHDCPHEGYGAWRKRSRGDLTYKSCL